MMPICLACSTFKSNAESYGVELLVTNLSADQAEKVCRWLQKITQEHISELEIHWVKKQ